MRRFTFLTIVCVALFAARDVRSQTKSTFVSRLSWMAGCWSQVGSSLVEEQWMAPRGRTMIGMSRATRGDTLEDFEYMQILERNGHLVYHAEPFGQPPADFHSVSVSDSLVVFENLRHDFPQRVIYRRKSADSISARIEGTMNGKRQQMDWTYTRSSCSMI